MDSPKRLIPTRIPWEMKLLQAPEMGFRDTKID
jgi:hypothetical protein